MTLPTPLRLGLAVPATPPRWLRDLAAALARRDGLDLCLMTAAPAAALAAPVVRLWHRLGQLDGPPLAADPPEGLDVLLDLGGGAPVSAAAPRRWRLLDDAGRDWAAPFAVLSAVAASPPTATMMLVEEADGAAPVVRGRAVLAVTGHDPDSLLRRLAAVTAHLVARAASDGAVAAGPVPAPRVPDGVAQVALMLATGGLRRAMGRLRRIFVEESWMVGVVDHPVAELLERPDLPPVRWLAAPDSHRYYADPFGLPDGRVLCEELRQEDGLGRIVALDPAMPGAPPHACPVPVPGHLSYPSVFVDGGAVYCVPEATASRRCVIYRLDGGHWHPHAVALEGVAAADPTLFRWGGRLWLAYADNDQGPHDTLCLAWAPELTGPWTRHPGNPVKVDARSARPAGTPFQVAGHLYRPAQDCSRTYGGAVTINRVTRLDPEGYAEEVARVLRPPPGPYPHGLHTVSAWGDRTLVDAKRHGLNPVALRRKLARRLAPRPTPQPVEALVPPAPSEGQRP